MAKSPIVSVVIPFYNAENTIQETLENALEQTYPYIEIILVNDGSTDESVKKVEGYIESHKNIKLIHQDNAGVAAARNTGIKESKGQYIAPIDADDLWHPKRIELHIEALERASPETAVAYSPAYILNEDSHIIHKPRKFELSGDVFSKQLNVNLVGNGSGLTIRKDALVNIGGYSPMLREKGAQGCEDYMVQMMLAHDYHYIAVPYYLIGYRVYEGNMSSDEIKMLKSRFLVYDYLQNKHDLDNKILFEGRKTALLFHTVRLLKKGQFIKSWKELKPVVTKIYHPVHFICIIWKIILYKLLKKIMKIIKKPFFANNNQEERLKFIDIANRPPIT